MKKVIHPAKKLKGQVVIPGDKSISHRSLMFSALAQGTSEVHGLLESDDVLSTKACLQGLGVEIKRLENQGTYVVTGGGLHSLRAPTGDLDCGNSGTTMRLLMGLLAGQKFSTTMIGDVSLSKRPMKRVTEPLSLMGCRFSLTDGNFAPLTVIGKSPLVPLSYSLPVASAQVKSAILLAGLFAEGTTTLTGLIQSRDHTERMLSYMGVQVKQSADKISIKGLQELQAKPLQVPSDPSTAAFWAGAAAIISNGEVSMKGVLLNPTRIGFFEVLKQMGAEITWTVTAENPEPQGEVTIRSSELKGVSVNPEIVPHLIDEIPLLAIVASQATGVTEVRGAEELRVKESDRISALVTNMRALGIEIEELEDGFRLEGPQQFQPGQVETFHDHRIAMAFSIAGLVAAGPVQVNGAEVVSVSYPNFYDDLERLIQ